MAVSGAHARRERKKLTEALRRQVIERDGLYCLYCGKFAPNLVAWRVDKYGKFRFVSSGLNIDHVRPISKGGRSVLENLRVSCQFCNLSKHVGKRAATVDPSPVCMVEPKRKCDAAWSEETYG